MGHAMPAPDPTDIRSIQGVVTKNAFDRSTAGHELLAIRKASVKHLKCAMKTETNPVEVL